MKQWWDKFNGYKLIIGVLITVITSWATLNARVLAVERCADDLKQTPIKIAQMEQNISNINENMKEIKSDMKEVIKYVGEFARNKHR